jgi:hypothetical protein
LAKEDCVAGQSVLYLPLSFLNNFSQRKDAEDAKVRKALRASAYFATLRLNFGCLPVRSTQTGGQSLLIPRIGAPYFPAR